MPALTSETYTAGGFVEFGVNGPGTLDADYVRLRGGQTFGSSGITSNTLVGEYLPIRDLGFFRFGSPNEFNSAPIPYVIEIDPDVMVQYDELTSGARTYTLFKLHEQAVRLGPQFTFRLGLSPNAPATTFGIEHDFLAKFVIGSVIHDDIDVCSGRNYFEASASLTYNATQYLGVSASYTYGNSETTGNLTNPFKLGLSAKL